MKCNDDKTNKKINYASDWMSDFNYLLYKFVLNLVFGTDNHINFDPEWSSSNFIYDGI